MIHSAGLEASAVQEVSKLISESLAGSITIGDMRIDGKGNIQYKDSGGNWTTVISTSEALAANSTVHKYIDTELLKAYEKKRKEYSDKRIDEKLNLFNEPNNKYKIMT